MTKFRVGQRVRVVANHTPRFENGDEAIGREGVITMLAHLDDDEPGWMWDCEIELDGDPFHGWDFLFSEIAPLTDPRAADFIADMERYAHLTKPRVTADVS